MKHRNFKKSKGILSIYLYVQKMGGKPWKKNRTLLMHLIDWQKIGSFETSNTVIATLDKFTCAIYRYLWERLMNPVRTKLFEKKYTKEGKVVYVSLLVLSNFVLILHIQRVNYVAKMWKPSLTNWLDWDGISEKEWLPDGLTYWLDEIFPRDVEEILCNSLFISDHFDEFNEEDKLPDDNSENYDDGNDEWEYWFRLFTIRLQVIELALKNSIYKLIYNSSYYLLDICYHYFQSVFLVFNLFTNYVIFLSPELRNIWIFGYNKVSVFNPCSFMCIVP